MRRTYSTTVPNVKLFTKKLTQDIPKNCFITDEKGLKGQKGHKGQKGLIARGGLLVICPCLLSFMSFMSLLLEGGIRL